MERRYCSLYFPRLAVDRLEREVPARRARALAVVHEERGHPYVASVNVVARQAGLRAGMRVADARALAPQVELLPADPAADAAWLQRLLEWSNQYSPLVAADAPDGILLDTTGVAQLFGGEAAMRQQILARIARWEIHARAALAAAGAAAWALAHYSAGAVVDRAGLEAALDALPVMALRIPWAIAHEMEKVGLRTIGFVRRVPRQSVGARYGPQVLLRLDQAFGLAEEPLAPYRPPAEYRALRNLAEPIGSTLAVEHVVGEMARELARRLEKDHRGARRLELQGYRVDGSVARLSIRTSRPGRSVTHWMRLLGEKLNGLDAGFGIETMTLEAPEAEELELAQMALPYSEAGPPDEGLFEEMLDRLGLRLGFPQVCRFRLQESLLAEEAVEMVPAIQEGAASAEWPELRVRPLRLVEPPMPIEVGERLPEQWPILVRIGGETHRVVRMEGPERLTAEWWRERPAPWDRRDYYRIENDQGHRWWIFRETRAETERWFLHGHFA